MELSYQLLDQNIYEDSDILDREGESPEARVEDDRARFKFPCQEGWGGKDCSQPLPQGNVELQEEHTQEEQELEYEDLEEQEVEEQELEDQKLEEPLLGEQELGEQGLESEELEEQEFEDQELGGGIVVVGLSESVLIDTEGVPQVCRPYIDMLTHSITETTPPPPPTSLPLALDKIQVNTVSLLDDRETTLNSTVETLGSWLLVLQVKQASRLSLRVASRSAISCLASRTVPPSLVQFEILDIADGASREALEWDLLPGE